MKKILSVLIISSVFFSLISCGSSPKNPDKNNPDAPENSAETKTQEPEKPSYIEPVLPETEMFLLDDFEDGNYWYAVRNSWDEWGSHNLSLTAELSEDWGSAGLTSLNCSMEPATKESSKQACWCCDAPLIKDFSEFKYVAFDILNPERFEFNLSFVIQANNWNKWDVTKAVKVPQGEHTVLLELDSNFPAEDLMDVNRMIIQSTGENPGGHFYIDNLRLY